MPQHTPKSWTEADMLLYCPFCGGPAEVPPSSLSPRPASMPYQIRCAICHCSTPWCSLASIAISRWSRRLKRKPAAKARRPAC